MFRVLKYAIYFLKNKAKHTEGDSCNNMALNIFISLCSLEWEKKGEVTSAEVECT